MDTGHWSSGPGVTTLSTYLHISRIVQISSHIYICRYNEHQAGQRGDQVRTHLWTSSFCFQSSSNETKTKQKILIASALNFNDQFIFSVKTKRQTKPPQVLVIGCNVSRDHKPSVRPDLARQQQSRNVRHQTVNSQHNTSNLVCD